MTAPCAVVTLATFAVKAPLVEPAGTLNDAGTTTALLLLARVIANPPVLAAVFNVTVQLSVPAPGMDPLVQVRPVNTGMPVPLRLKTEDAPDDELLVSVTCPEAAPAEPGVNCTVRVWL